MAAPSLSPREKLAGARLNDAARKFFDTFLTQLANRSAWVDI